MRLVARHCEDAVNFVGGEHAADGDRERASGVQAVLVADSGRAGVVAAAARALAGDARLVGRAATCIQGQPCKQFHGPFSSAARGSGAGVGGEGVCSRAGLTLVDT